MATLQEQITKLTEEINLTQKKITELNIVIEQERLKYEEYKNKALACKAARDNCNKISKNLCCPQDELSDLYKVWDTWAYKYEASKKERDRLTNLLYNEETGLIKQLEKVKESAQSALQTDPTYLTQQQQIAEDAKTKRQKYLIFGVVVVVVVFVAVLIFRK